MSPRASCAVLGSHPSLPARSARLPLPLLSRLALPRLPPSRSPPSLYVRLTSAVSISVAAPCAGVAAAASTSAAAASTPSAP